MQSATPLVHEARLLALLGFPVTMVLVVVVVVVVVVLSLSMFTPANMVCAVEEAAQRCARNTQ